jgi:protein subunit release factor B
VKLPDDDEALLKECRVDTYRASGKGGQHVNVTDSAVRLTHIPSGLVVTCQKERSQYLNKRHCLTKLREKVKKLNYKKPKRIATKMSRSTKAKNRVKKTKSKETKRLRARPDSAEDF